MLNGILFGSLRSRGTAIDYTKIDDLLAELGNDFNITLHDPDLGCRAEGFKRVYAVRKYLGETPTEWYLGGVFLSGDRETIFVPYNIAEDAALKLPDVKKALDDVKSVVSKYTPVC